MLFSTGHSLLTSINTEIISVVYQTLYKNALFCCNWNLFIVLTERICLIEGTTVLLLYMTHHFAQKQNYLLNQKQKTPKFICYIFF